MRYTNPRLLYFTLLYFTLLYVAKNPRSDDYRKPVSLWSHPRSRQRLLSNTIRPARPTDSWPMWRRPTSCLSVCVAKILYASPACMSGFTATDRQRVDAFLRCNKRCGFCPPDLPSFDELLEDIDDKLFNKINNDVEHLLHSLFPPAAVVPDHYKLRQRVHNRSLPTRTGRLTDSNFINRLLFKDIYWWCSILTVGHYIYYVNFIYFIFILLTICTGCGLSTSIKDHDDDGVSSTKIPETTNAISIF